MKTLDQSLPSAPASAARPSRTARKPEGSEGPDVDSLAFGDLERFWGQALQNLKIHLEAERAPPAGEPPRK
jgi:hypothetical protein